MSLLEQYQETQNDLQTAVDSRSKLDAQLTENETVKKVKKAFDLFQDAPLTRFAGV